jgi:predicted ferric reductase
MELKHNPEPSNTDTLAEPAISFKALIAGLLAVALGAFAAAVILPAWLPNLVASLLGPEPKAYWYMSRGTAVVAYLLLWLSMALGVGITNRMAQMWPGGPLAADLHEYLSLAGMAFGMFHALILMGDKYIAYTLAQVLLPFASTSYRPVWVGLGQIGLYTFAIVNLSFYVRKRIGTRTWRLIHYLSYATFALALLHGIFSGTDVGLPWMTAIYWTTGVSLIFLTIYRILFRVGNKKPARAVAAQAVARQ